MNKGHEREEERREEEDEKDCREKGGVGIILISGMRSIPPMLLPSTMLSATNPLDAFISIPRAL